MDKIEQLQNHESVEIYKVAFDIIERYFSEVNTFKKCIYVIYILIVMSFSRKTVHLFKLLVSNLTQRPQMFNLNFSKYVCFKNYSC